MRGQNANLEAKKGFSKVSYIKDVGKIATFCPLLTLSVVFSAMPITYI